VTLISRHRDGRIIAKAVSWFGIGSVEGSSTRGGSEATLRLLEKLREKCVVAITPDGPRGPIYKPKDGAVKIAQLSGASIYPAAFSAEKYWKFKSWDQMILPKPFSRAVFVQGEPINVPADASEGELQRYSSMLESGLKAVTESADNFKYGRS
jgi:lysophospholipid acyltransferase (LPLAT)-like uncharacterized protein